MTRGVIGPGSSDLPAQGVAMSHVRYSRMQWLRQRPSTRRLLERCQVRCEPSADTRGGARVYTDWTCRPQCELVGYRLTPIVTPAVVDHAPAHVTARTIGWVC